MITATCNSKVSVLQNTVLKSKRFLVLENLELHIILAIEFYLRISQEIAPCRKKPAMWLMKTDLLKVSIIFSIDSSFRA
jgi:hypothetical protein